jgi:hypothetical protein
VKTYLFCVNYFMAFLLSRHWPGAMENIIKTLSQGGGHPSQDLNPNPPDMKPE